MSKPSPLATVADWLAEAEKSEPHNPNAMALATATPDGRPSVRMVLLKSIDDDGVVFYTNTSSRKGEELKANPRAAVCMYWKTLNRQVRIEGRVTFVSDEEADAYFASRARQSQIGAWASRQSQPSTGKLELEKEVARYALKFGVSTIPRPEYWTGLRIEADCVELWSEGLFRLHERKQYRRHGAQWEVTELFP
ncbi:MAG: pyridoxamine 5'-phosphate oxidase [Gammaproteobacteria bacterium]|nr:pyridoxamine 5'-phosphate oxidase [Gammaproteobacteria bacterium]